MKIRRIGSGGCELTKETLDYNFSFLKNGQVMLIDEGWGYQSEHVSEKIVGEWIKDKDRSRIFLVDKLPLFDKLYQDRFGFSIYDTSDEQLNFAIRSLLDEQLKLLNVEYLDCYMLHALFDMQYSNDYDENKEIDLYKRIVPVLIDLKKEGKVKSLGFSCHITYSKLLMFLQEVDPKNTVFKYAEVSYNIFNNRGYCQKDTSWYKNQMGIMVWDAIGEKGIKHLKDLGYTVFGIMPFESGRIRMINTSDSFLRWAAQFVWNNEDLDVIIPGTSKNKHLEVWLQCNKDIPDIEIPDFRTMEGVNGNICGVSA